MASESEKTIRAKTPVIAIDGPTASGKGTVAARVAAHFGFHYLDSGALYRLVALAALEGGLPLEDGTRMAHLAQGLDIGFRDHGIWLNGRRVEEAIRSEEVGKAASRIAALAALRNALVERQLGFRQPPGLVADGRDMGTVIFPDAALKIFLTASAMARAQRRTKQLIEKGIFATLSTLLRDLEERDRRDASRAVAPLVAAEDALVIDSSDLTIDEVVDRIVREAQARGMA